MAILLINVLKAPSLPSYLEATLAVTPLTSVNAGALHHHGRKEAFSAWMRCWAKQRYKFWYSRFIPTQKLRRILDMCAFVAKDGGNQVPKSRTLLRYRFHGPDQRQSVFSAWDVTYNL